MNEVIVMTLVEQYRRWFEYEKDSHRRVLAALETVPKDGRGSESYQKALNTMGHIVAARRVWLHRFDPAIPGPRTFFPTAVTRDDVLAELEAMESLWSDYFQRLSEEEVLRAFLYKSSDGNPFRSVVADVLAQLHGHSLYHRGQIASLIRAAGGKPAETDFIYWSRESMPSQP
jgi:uncharacterized damage-inducible protein DinB